MWDDGLYTPQIAEELKKRGDVFALGAAISSWPDSRYDAGFLDEYLQRIDGDTADTLVSAFTHWPTRRLTPALVDIVLRLGTGPHLAAAGEKLPDSLYRPEIASALMARGRSSDLFTAGSRWPAGRFTKELSVAFARCATPRELRIAGMRWPDDRYTPEIGQRLAELCDSATIERLLMDWRPERQKDLLSTKHPVAIGRKLQISS